MTKEMDDRENGSEKFTEKYSNQMVPPDLKLIVLGLIVALLVEFTCFYGMKSHFSIEEMTMGYQFDALSWLRGKTHSGFVDHLHKSLDQAGIKTFRDDLSIEPGDDIEAEIQKAIDYSSVKLIVISSADVSSSFLDELVLMVEQRKAAGHLLLPIFYHVHASVVNFRRAPFSQAFLDRLECLDKAKNISSEFFKRASNPREFFGVSTSDETVDNLRDYFLVEASRFKREAADIQEQLLKWKRALNDIAGLKPVVINEDRHENEAVKLIVARVVKHIAVKQSSWKALLAISQ